MTNLRSVASSGRVLGILMLQTRFPRVPGDIGHAGTFSCAVRYAVVAGATPQRVVRDGDPNLLVPFIEAGLSLVEQGATALTTSCGFLVRFQRQLESALPVPVWTSSLLLLSGLERAGVVTVDALALGHADLRAAGAASDTPVEGLAPGCSFQRTLLEDLPALDAVDAEAQVVGAALRLKRRHPELKHIVLECTNMPPYAGAVQAATGCTVHDITTLVARRFAAL